MPWIVRNSFGAKVDRVRESLKNPIILPYSRQTMLRVHLIQLVYNLSDPAIEDALYKIESMRQNTPKKNGE